MGQSEHRSGIEALLVDALSATLTRRMAERVMADVKRNRAGAPMPMDVDALLALVRGDLAHATFLRVGTRATAVLAEVENRVVGLAALPIDAWSGPRVRLVFVGRNAHALEYLARELHAQPVIRVDHVFELLIALDAEERTLLVIDEQDSALDPTIIARFVPDFSSWVLTFVAGASPGTRAAFLDTGAAFRATLRSEPLDHPEVPQMLRDLVSGIGDGGARRTRGGTSTTTQPAQAA